MTFKKLTAIFIALLFTFFFSISSLALNDPYDTAAGKTAASSYLIGEFHKGNNLVFIPDKYFKDISGGATRENAIDVFKNAIKESPYLFCSTGFVIYDDVENGIEVERISYYDKQEEANLMNKVECVADNIIRNIIDEEMSEYQKAMMIYSYLIYSAEYDWEAAQTIDERNYEAQMPKWVNASSAYGCLIEGKAICTGYAKAFNLLARKAGLTTSSIEGTNGKFNHIWNRCLINGLWYEVDATYKVFTSNTRDYIRQTGISNIGKVLIKDGTIATSA